MRFITHAGVFHADEVFATAILRRAFPDPGIPVIRTYDPGIYDDPEDIVYDIGEGPLDHHQRHGAGCRPNGVPYASAGLVWRAYGRGLCSCDYVFRYVDRGLIQGIDAQDAGMDLIKDPACSPMTVSGVISAFNPTWDDPAYDALPTDKRFLEAVDMASGILARHIANGESSIKAKAIIDRAIEGSEGHVMVLEDYCPWSNWLCRSRHEKAKDVFYAVFPSARGGWNWQAAPIPRASFSQRCACPAEWRGMPADGLKAATGIPEAMFCHASGFIGACGTMEAAVKMAKLAAELGTVAPAYVRMLEQEDLPGA